MIVSLRRLARSRCLRAIGVLAWLMLVTTSLVAAPMGMANPVQASMHAATTATSVHCAPDSNGRGSMTSNPASHDGCGSHASTGCHCATMCASVAPKTLPLIAAVPMSASYDMRSRLTAPSPNTAPPLRPPSI